jgi:hypothetical protein
MSTKNNLTIVIASAKKREAQILIYGIKKSVYIYSFKILA